MNDEGGAPTKSYDPKDVPADLVPEEMRPVLACSSELSPAMRAVMLRHPKVRVLCIMLPMGKPSRHMMHIGNVPEDKVTDVLTWAAGESAGKQILSRESMEPEQ